MQVHEGFVMRRYWREEDNSNGDVTTDLLGWELSTAGGPEAVGWDRVLEEEEEERVLLLLDDLEGIEGIEGILFTMTRRKEDL
ncbi:hypothetical protein E2C01_016246 [Portunus trituberculatus]|uniref:Uncharacterized protein n=1 Tax=Portunus trituberculatus TaxID=210409 RepID=A0A5B7DQJ5_PORTR|nr:hypothetical protein [Portunus trituberculatus]